MHPSLPRCRLVLFDLDGTLVDSAPDLCAAVAAALRGVGLPPHDVDAVRSMIGEGQRVLIERAVTRAGATPSTALIDDVLFRFRSYYSEHLVVRTTLYQHVRETLRALSHDRGLPLAVATNKPGAWARRIIEAFDLLDCFGSLSRVLGEDDVGARKPDPRLLLSLCQAAGVPPAETLMVGDSAIDRQAAARAGTQFAFCTFGFGDQETVTGVHADVAAAGAPLGTPTCPYVLDSMAQLLDVPPLRRAAD